MSFDITKAVEQYGPIYSVKTPESNVEVFFRLVSKKEYDTFNSLCDETGVTADAEDYLYNTAIVYPVPIQLDEDIYAGESSSIVAEIARQSGFFDLQTFANAVSQSRAECQKLSEQIIIFIAKAMPGYTIDDLEKLNYQQLARLLSISEVIMGQVLDLGINKPVKGNILSRGDKKLSPEEIEQQNKLTGKAKEALESIRERR